MNQAAQQDPPKPPHAHNPSKALRKRMKKAKRDVAAAARDLTPLARVVASCDDRKVVTRSLKAGVYRDRDKWRVLIVEGTARQSLIFESREEAESVKDRMLAEARLKIQKSIGESLDDYRDYRIKYRGVKTETAEHGLRHLRYILPVERPIASLTPEIARKLYLDYAARPNQRNGKPLSANTHRWVLLIAKCWGKWCVKAGLCAKNPFESVEPIGKPNAGKSQLRINEALRFDAVLVKHADHRDQAAVGALLMLHHGLRQGEVSARVARDVDAGGAVLWIPFGKTEGARRRLEIASWLHPYLLNLTEGKAPDELIFSEDGKKLRGRTYWWRKVREWCAEADVPLVCPHSLRGLHATLATEAGATGEAVARALGHTSFAMTAKHYASADSVANARSSRVANTLSPTGPNGNVLDSILAGLDEEQRQELRRRLLAQ